jgi:hypothetical protein
MDMQIASVGIDLGKTTFHLVALTPDGSLIKIYIQDDQLYAQVKGEDGIQSSLSRPKNSSRVSTASF